VETSLHRQLKSLYGGAQESRQEVQVDGYRIDAIEARTGRLIEIQSAPLAALRDKVRRLLEAEHKVLVVKPLVGNKRLIYRDCPDGEIRSTRKSPLQESWYHLFLEMVHFVGVFPHPGLTLEVLLTTQEEHRLPPQRRRRRARYRVQDRVLVGVDSRLRLRTAADLRKLLPPGLPPQFSTADLARVAGIPRWLAQKMAYCLRKTEAVQIAGKQRNTILYAVPSRRRRAA